MKTVPLILVTVIGLFGAGFFGVRYISNASYGPADLDRGQRAFTTHCVACHGSKGLGDGVAAAGMVIKPDNIYQELTNPLGFKAELIQSVLEGDNGQNGSMPAFKGILSEDDINDIFGYVLDLNAID